MSEKHLDRPGEITWLKGRGPAAVLGPCPHEDCVHTEQSVIAWGPDKQRYELVECVWGCEGQCRAWTDGSADTTSSWLQVAP